MYSFVSRENHMYGIIHNTLILLYLLYIANNDIPLFTYQLNTDSFVLRTLAILRKFAPASFEALCSFSFGRPIAVFAAASGCFSDCSPALIDNKEKGRCSL